VNDYGDPERASASGVDDPPSPSGLGSSSRSRKRIGATPAQDGVTSYAELVAENPKLCALSRKCDKALALLIKKHAKR
jgi:hypothetical protein